MGFLIIELLRRESVSTRFRISGRKIVCEQSERIPAGSGADLPAFLEAAAAARREDDTVILAVDPSLLSCREMCASPHGPAQDPGGPPPGTERGDRL